MQYRNVCHWPDLGTPPHHPSAQKPGAGHDRVNVARKMVSTCCWAGVKTCDDR